MTQWITVAALSLLLVEGFVLSVFPQQVKQLLEDAEPSLLQILGLTETVIATGLIVGLMLS